MKISRRILYAILVVGLLGTSCDKIIGSQIKKVVDRASNEKEDEPDIIPEEDEGDPAIGAALNIYTGCINRASKSVLASRARYLSWAKNDTTRLPSTRSRLRKGLYPIKSQSETCLKDLRGLKDAKLFPELFVAGTKYKTALAALTPVVEEAYLYYNEQDYKDDKAAKAKKWHPMLVTGFQAFLEVDKIMRKELSKITDVRQAAYLKKVEAQSGRTLPFLLTAVSQSATKLVRLTDVPVKEVNVDDVEGTLERYIALVAEMETYAAANPEETKKYFAFSSVISAAVGLRKDTKSFIRTHRRRSGNRSKQKASSKVIAAYNRWIERSNRSKK